MRSRSGLAARAIADEAQLMAATGNSDGFMALQNNAIARYAATSNVANLAAFTVAQDGVTGVAGDLVLLPAQTVGAQNGLYVIGAVSSGTAPLTRSPLMPTGDKIVNGMTVSVSEGTIWRGSTWRAMATTTGGAVVGTNDPAFYPQFFRKTITLASGTYTIGAGGGSEPLFLFSTTTSSVTVTRNTAGTPTATTGGYAAPVASRIAGIAPTAAVLVQAQVAAGTISNADTSTLDVVVTNW